MASFLDTIMSAVTPSLFASFTSAPDTDRRLFLYIIIFRN